MPFDTGGANCGGQSCADQYLAFWVVVWMEDAQGVLVPELPDHGLTDNPSGLSFAQVTDVPVEAFSNNVGLYGSNTPFYVAAPNSVLTSPSASGALTIGGVSVSPTALPDQKAKVQAQILTGAEPSGATLVAFYDGDPRQGGRALDVHHIAALRADDTYQSQVFYRPQSCGEHTVYVVVGPATSTPATATVQVTIEPVPLVEALTIATARLALPLKAEVKLLAKLALAKHAFEQGHLRVAGNRLKAFMAEVEAQRGVTLTGQQADLLIAEAKQIIDRL